MQQGPLTSHKKRCRWRHKPIMGNRAAPVVNRASILRFSEEVQSIGTVVTPIGLFYDT